MKVVKNKEVKSVLENIRKASAILDETYKNGTVSGRNAMLAQLTLALAEVDLTAMLEEPSITYGKKYKSKKKK